MSASCCGHDHHHADPGRGNAAYRRVLWAVLAINAAMFAVEIGAGVAAGSASLQADALDFFGDAANYAISLFVVGMALRYRAIGGARQGRQHGRVRPVGDRHRGLARLARHAAARLHHGRGRLAALAANAASFGLLWAYRARRRQHALGLDLHAQRRDRQSGRVARRPGVFGTGTGWPDIIVAAIMAALALQGAWTVIRQSLGEFRHPLPVHAPR